MKIVAFFYEQMTALDAVGPLDVLARIPGAEILIAGLQVGTVRAEETGLGLAVDHAIDDVSSADLLLVPGGFGTRARLVGEPLAQGIQLGIEYDPQPPFDMGSPDKAPAALVAALRGLIAGRETGGG